MYLFGVLLKSVGRFVSIILRCSLFTKPVCAQIRITVIKFLIFYMESLPLLPALMAQWANAQPQCSRPGWLARRHGFDSHCCRHVKSGFCLHVMRLNSRADTEGSPISS